MSRHRAQHNPVTRVRYGRLGLLGVSALTTAVGVLGGVGALPSAADEDHGATSSSHDVRVSSETSGTAALTDVAALTGPIAPETADVGPTGSDARDDTGRAHTPPAVPDDSGTGRRVVFSEGGQRVWLVRADGSIARTYRVSGSVLDNLDPGTYQVFSRSEDAVGIDDSGTMKWFVRFTRGPSGAAIGFHTIPVKDGVPLQTKGQLGTALSHGCIRQKTVDALAMWDFAPIGTTVVVV
ncbi:L,D-transpeptidase [Nocardioides sp. R-C-SC26]|uniref:L,D-transpeptidase n=1 Tax=Nocardioides sp. R-C-SC26 TaxID=2870414 RepID=UPI001E598257|nr:L,D-transpeptidase [Nocardioides sp. R-C-SC26]